MTPRESPPVTDSDIMYLAIKRLERVAEKMMKREYDDELDHHMKMADQWFTWAAYNLNVRSGMSVPENEDDVDPFERAALIAENLRGMDGGPATPDQIATALRAWVRRTKVSETATPTTQTGED